MPNSAAHPYAGLTPDVVLDALESVGWRGDGRQLALNSYENRVYQIWMEDGAPLVAKFYRPQRWSDAQILEEHAFVRELAEREIPVVAPLGKVGSDSNFPELGEQNSDRLRKFESDPTFPSSKFESDPSFPKTLHRYAGFRFAVYPRRGGRAPELESRETLEWIGRFIGRIHAVGAARPFVERPALDIETFGTEPRDWLLAHAFIPADLREAWQGIAQQALAGVAHCYERAGTPRAIRLHGDCHAGNILWTPDGPHFVDFDDARSGPAVQDLWMLLSGDRPAMTRALGDVLAGYEDFMEFDRRELHLVEALRTLRLLHYSAWIARRWDDPAFPAAFPWFNTQRYWQDRILELREQVALMQEPPLAA